MQKVLEVEANTLNAFIIIFVIYMVIFILWQDCMLSTKSHKGSDTVCVCVFEVGSDRIDGHSVVAPHLYSEHHLQHSINTHIFSEKEPNTEECLWMLTSFCMRTNLGFIYDYLIDLWLVGTFCPVRQKLGQNFVCVCVWCLTEQLLVLYDSWALGKLLESPTFSLWWTSELTSGQKHGQSMSVSLCVGFIFTDSLNCALEYVYKNNNIISICR